MPLRTRDRPSARGRLNTLSRAALLSLSLCMVLAARAEPGASSRRHHHGLQWGRGHVCLAARCTVRDFCPACCKDFIHYRGRCRDCVVATCINAKKKKEEDAGPTASRHQHAAHRPPPKPRAAKALTRLQAAQRMHCPRLFMPRGSKEGWFGSFAGEQACCLLGKAVMTLGVIRDARSCRAFSGAAGAARRGEAALPAEDEQAEDGFGLQRAVTQPCRGIAVAALAADFDSCCSPKLDLGLAAPAAGTNECTLATARARNALQGELAPAWQRCISTRRSGAPSQHAEAQASCGQAEEAAVTTASHLLSAARALYARPGAAADATAAARRFMALCGPQGAGGQQQQQQQQQRRRLRAAAAAAAATPEQAASLSALPPHQHPHQQHFEPLLKTQRLVDHFRDCEVSRGALACSGDGVTPAMGSCRGEKGRAYAYGSCTCRHPYTLSRQFNRCWDERSRAQQVAGKRCNDVSAHACPPSPPLPIPTRARSCAPSR
jgi:hypothetical protein